VAFWESLLTAPAAVGVAAVWGAIWGSFFNVVIARVPAGESVVTPPSHCRSCKRTLRWYDNVPILSYLLLRGRCRYCGARYSPRYALVETLVAALAAGLYRTYVFHGVGETQPGLRLAQFVIVSLFAGIVVSVAFIDLDTMRIPNAITYPGIPLAAVLSVFMGLPELWDGPAGALGGYLLIRLIADGYEKLTGRQGMGYGDAKLLAMIGGLQGWRALLPTVFLASLQGTLIGVTALLVSRLRNSRSAAEASSESDVGVQPGTPLSESSDASAEDEVDRPFRHARIPFGPFLSLAALELLFARDLLPTLFPYLYVS